MKQGWSGDHLWEEQGDVSIPITGAQLWFFFFFLPFIGLATYQNRAKIIIKYPD